MAEPIGRRAHTILKQLVAIDEAMRTEEAERLCDGDAELLHRVRGLLTALSRTDRFLESPVGKTVRDAMRSSDQPGLPVIRGFRLERLVGVGGMAAVYEATQEVPRRRVALKVLRRSMAGTAALRRFEFETEVLAKLRHPGIAPIYEAGTFDDGAGAIPYFAMEFIEGARTLTQFCEAEGLDLRARLELMVKVCDAVQHGHQNGVIHRDLKPGNVLVDANGSPRVIDFGIARSTADEARGQHTTLGQIVGTLNAMSPEQCTPNATVDARTDVYSLGVLLYELLCGRPPHDLGALPVPEALRIIHDVAPRRPSAIDSRLRGDLESILLKAMEKDPERRYRTVAALGADLRRHLDHQTVEARPPTIFYQLRLLARRNRAAVAAAAVVALALVVATVVSIVFALQANDELRNRELAEARVRSERDTAIARTYAADIAAAISSLQFGDHSRMRGYLDEAPEQHRGWEWNWLDAFTNRSILEFQASRSGFLRLLASPDGSRLMAVAMDGRVRTFSGRGLAAEQSIDLGIRPLNEGAISPDGGTLAAASERGEIAVVRAADGAILHRLAEPAGALRGLAFADPDTLVVGNGAGGLAVWDLAVDPPTRRAIEGITGVVGLRAAPDGSRLATWTADGVVTLRDTERFASLRDWTTGGEVGSVDLRPDIDRLAIGCLEGEMRVYAIGTGEEIVSAHSRDQLSLVSSVALSSDGAFLAAGQRSGPITIVDVAGRKLRSASVGHRGAIDGLAFLDGSERLVSGSWDGTIRMWKASTSTVNAARELAGHDGAVLAVAFAPTVRKDQPARLLSCGVDRTVRVWEADHALPQGVLAGHEAGVYDVAVSPDGTLVASASQDDTVRLWDLATQKEVAVLRGHTGPVWAVSFSPDGSLLASVGSDKTVRVWDVATRSLRQSYEGHTDRVIDVAFSHDGRRLASASRDGTVRIWSLDGSSEPKVLSGHDWDVFAVAWGIGDRELYSGSRDQTVRIWSPASGECLATLDGARQFVTSLSVSPDGSRLAAGTWYGAVCLFDIGRRELVASFRAVNGTIRGLSFGADGRLLAVASGDGSVRVLDANPDARR